MAPTLAIAAGVIFTAIVFWLQLRRSDVDARVLGISHYAVGPTYLVMTVGFVVMAVGFASAAIAIGAWVGAGTLTTGLSLLLLIGVPALLSWSWRA